MPILCQTLGLMGARDIMLTKAMALTLRAHGLAREVPIQQTITQIYYSYIILYVIELSSCDVFFKGLWVLSQCKEKRSTHQFPNETDGCRCVSQFFCHSHLLAMKLFFRHFLPGCIR